MVKGKSNLLMDQPMKDNFISMTSTEKDIISGQIINRMMVNGCTIKCMGKGRLNGVMVHNISRVS